MASQLRERKKGASKQTPLKEEDTKKDDYQPPDLEPNLYVAISIMLIFGLIVGAILYYKVDQSNNGPFAAFVNNNFMPKNRYQKVL